MINFIWECGEDVVDLGLFYFRLCKDKLGYIQLLSLHVAYKENNFKQL
ncbi:MAG: hypothetical protein PHE56_01840 [Bacteroidales bacterium]|nr:hypothetical protein [Bacteroidales bacterium]